MDNMNRINRPIVTGTPSVQNGSTPAEKTKQAQGSASFIATLQQKLQSNSNTAFSKHAVNRVMERKIDVSDTNLERLDHGMKLAQQKGLKDALILIDQNAYIVNAAQARVVTVNNEELKGSVFTNIDGTVIV